MGSIHWAAPISYSFIQLGIPFVGGLLFLAIGLAKGDWLAGGMGVGLTLVFGWWVFEEVRTGIPRELYEQRFRDALQQELSGASSS